MGVDPPIMQGSLDHFHPVVAPFSSLHKADIKANKSLDPITNQFYCFLWFSINLLSKFMAMLPLDENLTGPISIKITCR